MSKLAAENELSELGVSRETFDLLERYVSLLDDWRQRMNLIGPKEMDHIWTRHISDCAQLIPLIGHEKRIVDVGSGAGLPGLVLGCHAATTGGHVTLIESTGKKCAFLREVSTLLDLPVSVQNVRIESAKAESVDFITARALAPLPRLLDYTNPWLSQGATGLFFKGERWQQELTDAADCWTLSHETIPSRSSDTGVILKIEEAHRV
ncbi:16S rRNA (guanine(527)-N(7))-methyltransferase RsmG [Henriciella litoralis]|uniref:16S rRNA (guanine(527)-N(7))-methyltransferase RsmG n=1 Tax=Henriciella litoralis TaxID=568102 RepID=UPI001F3FED0B|nr:16S rRNA (guanine(527)-N(7))-methyltransferase RsmG [Henriciella litoralis]